MSRHLETKIVAPVRRGRCQTGGVLLAEVAAASVDVAATRSRTAKAERLAQVLRAAAPDEVAVVAAWLSGELRQRRTGVGWRSLQGLPEPAASPSLEVLEVDEVFAQLAGLAGAGSGGARTAALRALWARATADEQQLLAGLVSGELRQGASAGLVADAVARAAQVPVAAVRRALTLHGSLPDVAAAALTGGAAALDAFGLVVGRGLAPMLAGTAVDLDDAWDRLGGRAAVDAKLDGVRIQVHRDGDDVRVLTRSLDDVTERMPEVVEAVRALPARQLVLDGEALALVRRRSAAAVPGDGVARGTQLRDHADAVVLRPAARRRDRPARRPAGRAQPPRWRRSYRSGSARPGWSRTTGTPHARSSPRRWRPGTRASSSRRSTRRTRPVGAAARG